MKLLISKRAGKELRGLPDSERKKINDKIKDLLQNPHPHGSKKLAGAHFLYRLRHGDYRVIYQIIDEEIAIRAVGHRREVYRD